MKTNIEFNQELSELEDDLEQLYIKAKILFSLESDTIVEDLLLLNTKESKELASDIIDTQNEICTLNEIYDQREKFDDPFNSLYDEDIEN